ncbi:hypothetical protein M422DRAFT_255657 [Sphaerobolus stellatus SS14]|uniref:Uncharacterized protein n=1 Tax=Sphaerobolus stellatus (strain SS14) TaxID=990650 RepID=A0A0C9V3G2_SPHS4|nr:hypothetical protein M422DRAFT_255657 [Sphaerobolus stellatus SS14]
MTNNWGRLYSLCQGTTLKFHFHSRPDSASTPVDRIPESETPTVRHQRTPRLNSSSPFYGIGVRL